MECQLKRSKVKVTGLKNAQNWRHVYLGVVDESQADPMPTANYGPTPLLGLIYWRRLNMRRSTTGSTAASHVGTGRSHAALFTKVMFSSV